ncbi:AraC family transcriptional regulator [Rheinheimera hassiensis]|uniref:AraC family transcriptional regulator n=1 Tax=Rheinheimera hassiensis TaxID=1193627 RepID=UPI001F05602B|nr:helix-turn-helix domain-containing protein [Rheinheimera hassiensis]
MQTVQHCKVLFEDHSLRVISKRYAASTIFKPHYDKQSRITLTLNGAVAEDVAQQSAVVMSGDILLKSYQTRHENRYCAAGATHITIEPQMHGDDGLHDKVDIIGWQLQKGNLALLHTAAAIDAAVAGNGAALHVTIGDICAAAVGMLQRRPKPPAWLNLLKAQIEETGLVGINISDYASSVGVHPAHISRLFHSCFGTSITLFAQSHAVKRALQLLLTQTSLADIAVAVGFYDQSHMCRVFRRATGHTPGYYQRLWLQADC